ncbi:hypothetical protein BamMEX5DRAFT_1543 [Burkholderia ambifaria MEX-5]|uniref:Uncharacterized protein n=1 Tax=Burkholderia ambifaria MEX-5 TaxID=396597 RepID=B1T177_9BURK|nr:hypothetical protein BamMEX5DRAFT_1543 [Burkholderia ambifaria MEX-5]
MDALEQIAVGIEAMLRHVALWIDDEDGPVRRVVDRARHATRAAPIVDAETPELAGDRRFGRRPRRVEHLAMPGGKDRIAVLVVTEFGQRAERIERVAHPPVDVVHVARRPVTAGRRRDTRLEFLDRQRGARAVEQSRVWHRVCGACDDAPFLIDAAQHDRARRTDLADLPVLRIVAVARHAARRVDHPVHVAVAVVPIRRCQRKPVRIDNRTDPAIRRIVLVTRGTRTRRTLALRHRQHVSGAIVFERGAQVEPPVAGIGHDGKLAPVQVIFGRCHGARRLRRPNHLPFRVVRVARHEIQPARIERPRQRASRRIV